jgi:hypothetical protein
VTTKSVDLLLPSTPKNLPGSLLLKVYSGNFFFLDTKNHNMHSHKKKLRRLTPVVGGTAVSQWLRYCATVGDRGSTVVKVLRYSGGPR